ncbi:hypothetical protein J2T09_005568 [Neorhizobium huautlense]|uniref:Uncharacterized protein n=1 Tax=Neorhizobium huautlense TaxID=67774 RepID=A0ABT9Q212_9HYPH|nr:hypothetical protein [Neorhizobium huautlense]
MLKSYSNPVEICHNHVHTLHQGFPHLLSSAFSFTEPRMSRIPHFDIRIIIKFVAQKQFYEEHAFGHCLRRLTQVALHPKDIITQLTMKKGLGMPPNSAGFHIIELPQDIAIRQEQDKHSAVLPLIVPLPIVPGHFKRCDFAFTVTDPQGPRPHSMNINQYPVRLKAIRPQRQLDKLQVTPPLLILGNAHHKYRDGGCANRTDACQQRLVVINEPAPSIASPPPKMEGKSTAARTRHDNCSDHASSRTAKHPMKLKLRQSRIISRPSRTTSGRMRFLLLAFSEKRALAMGRRASIRSSDIKTTLAALKDAGIIPCAMDTLPDGSMRWHFTQPRESDEDDLDRELREFEQRHGGNNA